MSPAPAAPALVWFGSDSSAGGSFVWASRGPPLHSPPPLLSVVVSLASPRSLGLRLGEKNKQQGYMLALKVGQMRRGCRREAGESLPDSRGRFVGVQSVPWAVSVDVTPADGELQDERCIRRNDLIPRPTSYLRGRG